LLICPTCNEHFGGEEQFCPHDGSPLASESASIRGRDPLIGRVLGGRYRLEERLGQGGMGTVYRALHTLMDKQVALKILRAEMATDAEAVARFHREARSASRLDHDHCIRVMDFGQSDDGLLFLVMELLDGVSLGHVVRRGPVPAARAAAIGVAVAEALAHAHEQGIIHRDLKPDNVFLARRSRGRELVKVLDFGLAKLIADAALGPSITRDGTVFGTPEYMAPEQAEGEKLDGRTDVYALGIILYQLVTGDVPFRASNFVALLTKQVGEKPLPPCERRPDLDIPRGLEEVILTCLAKKAHDRYSSAEAVAEALEPFASADQSQLMLLPTRSRPASVETPLLDAGDRPSQKLHPPDPTPTGMETVLHGEVLPTRAHRRRWVAAFAGGAVLALASVIALVVVHKPAPAGTQSRAPNRSTTTPALETPLQRAENLIQSGDLSQAETILQAEQVKGDSLELEEALAVVAERRSGPLAELAAAGHLEKAARLQPQNAEPRARLAALLHRLGDDAHACKQARVALKLDPQGSRSGAARAVMAQARCSPSKETP
jgi:serine/threonine-protein kinase